MGESLPRQNIILVGDLNMMLSHEDNEGVIYIIGQFREILEDMILDWDLMDIKPIKGRYT